MSNAVATKKAKATGIYGLVSVIAGAFLIVAGLATWIAVSRFLKSEDITVAGDAAMFAGQTVDSPWTAFAQADIINKHALDSTNGETYATLGGIVSQHKAAAIEAAGGDSADEAVVAAINSLNISALNDLGADAEVVASTEAAAAAQGQRTTHMNASFLRASLFTSVVAFGVAALVMGVGLLFVLLGLAIRNLNKDEDVVVVPEAAADAVAQE